MTRNYESPVVLPSYVQEPRLAKADRLIGAHYFPGWKPGVHRGWQVLKDYPERKPVLGWYDESNPEVTDWEIKWALEHGISFFVYCWYRKKENAGQPITEEDLHLGHAIHEGLFHCRYKNRFLFAIMWENEGTRAIISSLDDLKGNVLPFWIEQYFSKPFYLRYNGRPVLFIYSLKSLIEQVGGQLEAKQAIDIIRAGVVNSGLEKPLILCEHRYASKEFLEQAKACTIDGIFSYCWHPKEQFPTTTQAFDRQLEKMEKLKEYGILPFIPTASVGWDPMPWSNENPETPWLQRDKMTRWYSTPDQFEALLKRVRSFADRFSDNSISRNMLLLDNWNEWGEGHFISPSAAAGFGYLQAVRNVFTDRNNLPDYRTPSMLGLGPYGPSRLD